MAVDRFGVSVAVAGETVVVGENPFEGGGAAYVFACTGDGRAEMAELTASDAASGDLFGYRLPR